MVVLFVIATIVFFLGVDWIVRRFQRSSSSLAAPLKQPLPAPYPLRIPEGVFFAKSHTWLSLFPSGSIRLGVDDFIGNLMETPRVGLIKRIGEKVEKGDPLLVLEDGDRRLTVRSPLSGEILALNPKIERAPELMHSRLFSDGWAYSIRPRYLDELRNMLLGPETRTWMSEELRRFRELLAGSAESALAPAVLQDGGTPFPGMLKQLDAAKLEQFEKQFLQIR